jgi:TetR/AcrR family transcriptional regulator, cholesterol catabolism regulator
MSNSGPLKETQSSLKKSQILDKAGTLFWQKGAHNTSMKEIADACNCRAANIYNYFESKEDILFEVIKDIHEQAVLSIKHLEEDEITSPVEQLRSLIKSHFGLLARIKRSNIMLSDTGLKDLSPEHRKVIIRIRDIYDSIMRKVIRRGIDSGDFVVKDERIMTYLISSMIVRSGIWYSSKGRLSTDEVGDIIFDLAYKGLKDGTFKPGSSQLT